MFFGGAPRVPISWIGAVTLLLTASVACDKLGLGGDKSPMTPTGPPAAGSTIVYTAVGASDATGHGASTECVPFGDCPNGTGYVPVAARQLRTNGFTVTLTNLGFPTAVIGPDFQALSAQYRPSAPVLANYIDQEMPFVPKETTVVTIFAGGNEVNTITAALGRGAGASDQAGYIDQQVKAFGADYATLLNGIKARAAARIVVLNLPNLAGLPYLAAASLPQRQAAQRAAVAMSTTVINPLTSQGATVVDLMCDARSYLGSNYFSDGFHPNDSGYAFIAGEVVRAITLTSYPAPLGSCSPMTLVR
jgi:lysophospholipase L1-like esterase